MKKRNIPWGIIGIIIGVILVIIPLLNYFIKNAANGFASDSLSELSYVISIIGGVYIIIISVHDRSIQNKYSEENDLKYLLDDRVIYEEETKYINNFVETYLKLAMEMNVIQGTPIADVLEPIYRDEPSIKMQLDSIERRLVCIYDRIKQVKDLAKQDIYQQKLLHRFDSDTISNIAALFYSNSKIQELCDYKYKFREISILDVVD